MASSSLTAFAFVPFFSHLCSEINRVVIREQGGVDLILQAMRTFPNHAGIQENGCGALYNLLLDGKVFKMLITAEKFVSKMRFELWFIKREELSWQ
jgi:hypothetical protein